MTNDEYKLKRVSVIAEVIIEWAESDERAQKLFEPYSKDVANWHKGRAEAYRMVANWLKETLHL